MPTSLRLVVSLAVALVAIPAVPARADSQGYITGHVTDASGVPLRGICASAVTKTDAAFPANTDASGNYAISFPPGNYAISLPPGNYAISFPPGNYAISLPPVAYTVAYKSYFAG